MNIEFDGCNCPHAPEDRWGERWPQAPHAPEDRWGERWPQAHYMAAGLIGEFVRVLRWTAPHDPDTGVRNSWLEAMWHVAENPPSFDAQWDEAFEDQPVFAVLPH